VGTPVAINMVLAGAVGVMILAVVFDIAFYAVKRLTTSRGIR
jgi:osmoprotectant transport system permease protein